MRSLVAGFAFALALGVAVLSALGAQAAMTNSDLIALTQARIAEQTQILAIEGGPTAFDLSESSLSLLRSGGVSPAVIAAMRRASDKEIKTTSSSQRSSVQGPNDRVLTNDEILAMVASGLSEDIIVLTIQSAKAVNFELSPAALIDLQRRGIPTAVIKAMIAAQRAFEDRRATDAKSVKDLSANDEARSVRAAEIQQFEQQLALLQRQRQKIASDVRDVQTTQSQANAQCNSATTFGSLNCLNATLATRAVSSGNEQLRQKDIEIETVQSKLNALRVGAATGGAAALAEVATPSSSKPFDLTTMRAAVGLFKVRPGTLSLKAATLDFRSDDGEAAFSWPLHAIGLGRVNDAVLLISGADRQVVESRVDGVGQADLLHAIQRAQWRLPISEEELSGAKNLVRTMSIGKILAHPTKQRRVVKNAETSSPGGAQTIDTLKKLDVFVYTPILWVAQQEQLAPETLSQGPQAELSRRGGIIRILAVDRSRTDRAKHSGSTIPVTEVRIRDSKVGDSIRAATVTQTQFGAYQAVVAEFSWEDLSKMGTNKSDWIIETKDSDADLVEYVFDPQRLAGFVPKLHPAK